MEEFNSTLDSSQDKTVSDGFLWCDKPSLDKEVKVISNIIEKNNEALKQNQDDIIKTIDLKVIRLNPIKGECDKIISDFLQNDQNVKKKAANNIATATNLRAQTAAVKKNITDLKNQLLHIDEKIKISEDAHLDAKERYKQLHSALREAKKFYSTKFACRMDLDELSDANGSCVVKLFFSLDENDRVAIKLFHNCSIDKFTDFDASSILSPAIDKQLREKLNCLDNIPALICILRRIALKK